MEYKCIDCRKLLKDKKHRSIRCNSCASKGKNQGSKNGMYGIKREQAPNWRGGLSFPKCIICGKNIWRGYIHCQKCAHNQYGDKNPRWKGGITPLRELIRGSLRYKEWRKEIFERDNYTCQECSRRGDYLEAHHKKEFNEVLQEFLNRYNQFSPYEDKETLVRLAINYQPFWDIDIGKTLCIECHNLTKAKKI